MANYLKVSMQDTIRTLSTKGWSNRRIARELGINRRTVNRYLAQDDSKCTTSDRRDLTSKITQKSIQNAPQVTAGSKRGKSLCTAYHDYIVAAMKRGLSAQRIYQDLTLEYSFTGSYESVKRYVRKLDDKLELPFRRMEMMPGREAQVDYGTGAWVYDSTGKRHKTHLFRITLSCCRKGYSEVSNSQDTESFLRSMENAFRSFGGVPETIVIDNLKAGVIKSCVYDPELNPKLRFFAEHYGTCILPTKVATPEHKGKVESSVKYVQNNALKGRKFRSLQAQNEYLKYWENQIADTRIHGTVRRQVKAMFEDEKPFLQELPPTLFPVFNEGKRKVHRDGHVEVAKAYYSVPAEYVKREVWVRYDLRVIRVYNRNMQEISMHARVSPGQFSTHSYHIPAAKISNPERGNQWLIKQADSIGGETGAWARAMLLNRGIPGCRVLNGLLQLAEKYTSSAINKGCKMALETEAFYLKELKYLIQDTYKAEQLKFDFLEEHPLIRRMSEYDNLTPGKELFSCRTNYTTN